MAKNERTNPQELRVLGSFLRRPNRVLIETFSKRQKRLKGGLTDVFTYNQISAPLRVQICHIWLDILGREHGDYGDENRVYPDLHSALSREFGMLQLPTFTRSHREALFGYFTQAKLDQALDMIELLFQAAIDAHKEYDWKREFRPSASVGDGIDELNGRFREHGVGYEFILGKTPRLIRKDNEHLHAEAVIPALRLLHENGFSGPDEEYRNAHEHYRHGRHKECLNECLKAFESTMKTICDRKHWPYQKTDTASTLIGVCLSNGLLPTFTQTHLTALRTALESAVPTVRNKLGGHGQGAQPVSIEPFFAEYLLHETAVTMVFLIEAFKASR